MALLSAYLSGWLVLLARQTGSPFCFYSKAPNVILPIVGYISYHTTNYTVEVLCIDYSTFVSDCIDCLVLYTIALLGNINGMCLV